MSLSVKAVAPGRRRNSDVAARSEARIDFSAFSGGSPLRFSSPRSVLQAHTLAEVPRVLESAEAAARQGYWAVGLVAYEAAPAFDNALAVCEPMAGFPLAYFAIYEESFAVGNDHGCLPVTASSVDGPWMMEVSRSHFEDDLRLIHEDILAGRFYQSNHTTRLRTGYSSDPVALYEALCAAQPAAYRFYLDGGDWQVLSVSPELFFDWTPRRVLTTRPMKGTAARHADAALDAAAAAALQASVKERAENLMIVDLLRNDVSRIAKTGTVAVSDLFSVQALPSVWQMTSTVRCQTRSGTRLRNVFAALFPCGSVTGAPKVTAMQSIAEREVSPRGPYCGALGVIRPGGHATFSVGIRTVLLRAGDEKRKGRGKLRQAECGVGSGITADASVAGEFAEWQAKRRFLLRASAGFQLIETLRLDQGAFALLSRHLARLAASAEHFGFACDVVRAAAALRGVAAVRPVGCWRVRFALHRNGKMDLEAEPMPPEPAPVLAHLARHPICGEDEFLRHDTSERQHGLASCRSGIADEDEVLLYNERGELTEFTRGNLVLELGGLLLTPHQSCGLLPGVLRDEWLALGKLREAVLTKDDLGRADRIWFLSALQGRVEVRMQRESCHGKSSY